MIFIFGYHPIRKEIGPTEERTCPNCNNQRVWVLASERYFISLFFLPVIPVNGKYFQYCPVCNYAEPLTKEEFQRKKPLAELNAEAVKKDMSEEEYEQRKGQLGA